MTTILIIAAVWLLLNLAFVGLLVRRAHGRERAAAMRRHPSVVGGRR